jgi:hypothetical protein
VSRRPFYFYLDEFQTYVGVAETSYNKLLSRGRKYAFGLILAHQQTSQLTKPILDTILGNVTTMITFSVAYADGMRLGQQYVMPQGGPLPAEEFVRQKVGEAICKINQTVFPLRVPLAPQEPNPRFVEYIIHRSAQNYGLHAYSRSQWEVHVKRHEPKLLPPKPPEPTKRPNPGQVF